MDKNRPVTGLGGTGVAGGEGWSDRGTVGAKALRKNLVWLYEQQQGAQGLDGMVRWEATEERGSWMVTGWEAVRRIYSLVRRSFSRGMM